MSRQQAIGKLLLGLAFGVIGLNTHASDDWVLFGGHIYTAEQANERAEAVVVRDGRIAMWEASIMPSGGEPRC